MRRAITIGGALVLAVVGALLLVSYVRGAERRALEGLETSEVYVAVSRVPQGTPAAELSDAVELRDLPRDALAEGNIADLDDLAGLITATDLVPGEQVLISHFETPVEAAVSTRIEVPAELLQATVSLSPERAVGGRLVPGDLVAVLASFEPFDLGAVEPGDPESLQEALEAIIELPGETDGDGTGATGPVVLRTPNTTHIIIHKVLVTGVQVEELPRESAEGTLGAVEFSPTGNLLITVAATAADIERIVFTAEHGTLWLALEDPEAPIVATEIQGRATIYEE